MFADSVTGDKHTTIVQRKRAVERMPHTPKGARLIKGLKNMNAGNSFEPECYPLERDRSEQYRVS